MRALFVLMLLSGFSLQVVSNLKNKIEGLVQKKIVCFIIYATDLFFVKPPPSLLFVQALRGALGW